MKIISVVGARPNFMKIAPFIHSINKANKEKNANIEHLLVHTGQHYDKNMSDNFFEALNIPHADINLGIGSGSHAEQVGRTMIEFEKVLIQHKPDWVIVVGDVNATLACSVTAKKLLIKCAHIEAGLRSGDMSMPEEVNRLVTDRLCDLLFTPDRLSDINLEKEGTDRRKIKFVGNIMIDTLDAHKAIAEKMDLHQMIQQNLKAGQAIKNISTIEPEKYAVVTLHRPSNVDHKVIFTALVTFLAEVVAKDMHIVWPIHPRAFKQLQNFGLDTLVLNHPNIILLEPIGYHEMLKLNMATRVMLTDSGGLQEECTVLGTPCLTLRWNTERPVTLIEHGGLSQLVGNEIQKIQQAYNDVKTNTRKPVRPERWDGNTADRIVEILIAENCATA